MELSNEAILGLLEVLFEDLSAEQSEDSDRGREALQEVIRRHRPSEDSENGSTPRLSINVVSEFLREFPALAPRVALSLSTVMLQYVHERLDSFSEADEFGVRGVPNGDAVLELEEILGKVNSVLKFDK